MSRSYEVLSPVKRGGRIGKIGSTVEIDDPKEAERLIASGTLKAIGSEPAPEKAEEAQPSNPPSPSGAGGEGGSSKKAKGKK